MGNIQKVDFFSSDFVKFWWEIGKIEAKISNSCATYFITKQPHFGVFHAKGTVVVSTVQVKKFKKYKSWNPKVR